MPKVRWTLETIKHGVERYRQEHGHLPTAWDFDRCEYLPSARQIQRPYGGLEKLRDQLGLTELNYTKGSLRQKISFEGISRGIEAEDLLEPILMDYFGEPFVHTQKKYYKKLKNRYDFFVYHHGGRFGVDVFSTERTEYIGPNIRHKLAKYANIPSDVPVYFVVSSSSLLPKDVEAGKQTARKLLELSHIDVVHMEEFLILIKSFTPLAIPAGFVSAIEKEQI